MSSNLENQETTEKLGHKSQGKVRACYGEMAAVQGA